jgi:hypothetical protein
MNSQKTSEMKEWIVRTTRIYRHGNICSLQRLQLDDEVCRRSLDCAIAVNGTSEATFERIKSTSKHLMLELL